MILNQLIPDTKAEKHTIRNSIILVGVLIFLDHLTKYLIVSKMVLKQKIPIIPGLFDLTYITNKGAAWGILSGYGWVLFAVSILVLGATIYYFRTLAEGWPERYYALGAIISGIIGNAIDRVYRHSVVDFLDFYIGKHHWPAFNIADSAITVGVTIYIISTIFRPYDNDEDKE